MWLQGSLREVGGVTEGGGRGQWAGESCHCWRLAGITGGGRRGHWRWWAGSAEEVGGVSGQVSAVIVGGGLGSLGEVGWGHWRRWAGSLEEVGGVMR